MRRIEHRALSWRIARDAAVASLPSDSARLLFTWMIAFQDNLGRLPGEPVQVRAEVGVRTDWSDEQIGTWLQCMHDVGLILWYTVDGMRFVQLLGHAKHQKLVGNMRATSDYPDPVHTPFERRSNVVRTEGEGEGEGEGTTHSQASASKATPTSTRGNSDTQAMLVNAARARKENEKLKRETDVALGVKRERRA